MPQFDSGSKHTARVVMRNPAAKPFDYSGFLYMGANQAVMAEVPFHLNAGESKNVLFDVTMPSAVGIYPVYVGVSSGGKVILPLYRAPENVQIVALGFSFGTPVVTLATDYLAPAWRVAEVACRVTNPNSVTVTRKISFWWYLWNKYTGAWDGPYNHRAWDGGAVEYSLTLSPGQSYNLVSPAHYRNVSGENASNTPLIGATSRVRWFVKDDLGNTSQVVQAP